MTQGYEFHDLGRLCTKEEIKIARSTCERYAKDYPITMVFPAVKKDAEHENYDNILAINAKHNKYTKNFIFPLDQVTEEEAFQITKNKIVPFAQEISKNKELNPTVYVLHNDNKYMQEFFRKAKRSIGDIPKGKGRSMWLSNGLRYIFSPTSDIIYQDTDVVKGFYTELYSLSLARPLIDPKMDIDFVNAYYDRISGPKKELKGRVNRFFTILLLAQKEVLGSRSPEIENLIDFYLLVKYRFSGEKGLRSKVANNMPLGKGYAVELLILGYIFNLPRCIGAQVDLGEFDHDHKGLMGLYDMTREIFTAELTEMFEIDPEVATNKKLFHHVMDRFPHYEGKEMRKWNNYCVTHGFAFNGAQDRLNNQELKKAVREGIKEFLRNPRGRDPFPAWGTNPELAQELSRSLEKMVRDAYLIILKNREIRI